MDSIYLRRHLSRNSLLRMLALATAAGGLIAWKLELINQFYFKDQLTPFGLAINGAIVLLFATGLLKMVFSFVAYMGEESAVTRFLRNLERGDRDDPMQGVSPHSIIGRRYLNLFRLHTTGTPVNQNAMAAALVASESTRNSFPKFINNILILSGVFGTIVSLSIALLGATDLLENTVDPGGMGLVIHGMSTALSTTITAIVCYVFFGYFYLKLTDAQTNLVSSVEQVTTNFLAPRFQVQGDTVLYEFTGLIRSLQGLVQQMEHSQRRFAAIEDKLDATLESYEQRLQGLGDKLNGMARLLRVGFRLRDEQ